MLSKTSKPTETKKEIYIWESSKKKDFKVFPFFPKKTAIFTMESWKITYQNKKEFTKTKVKSILDNSKTVKYAAKEFFS